MPKNKIGQELEAISVVLDDHRQIVDLVYKDLLGQRQADTGRPGLSAEPVWRGAVLKPYRQLTYEELAFHLEDSASFRAFARLQMGQYPSASTLPENIQAMSPATWEARHRLLLQSAAPRQVEKGRTVRIDATAVEVNIHPATDSTLLQDGIRVLTRLLLAGKTLLPMPQDKVVDHNRAAKRRVLEILPAKKEKVRLRAYRELLRLAGKVSG